MSTARSAFLLGFTLAGVAGFFWLWRSRETDPPSRKAASALASGLVEAMRAASAVREPHPCARLAPSPTLEPGPGRVYQLGPIGAARSRQAGVELVLEPDPRRPSTLDTAGSLTLGVVADARDTLDHLPLIRKAFADRSVSLVVSVGGLARDREHIHAALSTLTGPWLVLALPGDRESFTAHRDVCEELFDKGVVDGASVRVVTIGRIARLFTLPGAPSRARLLADVEGCRYSDGDVASLIRLIHDRQREDKSASEGVRVPVSVLVSHVPPRQDGLDASDRTAAGVHIGELSLARLLERTRIPLSIHGLHALVSTDSRGRPARKSAPLDPARPIIKSAGAADGIADLTRNGKWPPLALVITIERDDVRWEYIESHRTHN